MQGSVNYIFLKRKLIVASLVIIVWVIAAIFATIHEYFFLTNYPGVTDTIQMKDYSFMNRLLPAIAWAIMGGVMFSLIELFYLQRKLQNYRFMVILYIKFVVYFMMLIIINSLTSLFYNSIFLSKPIWNEQVLQRTLNFLISISFWHSVAPFILVLIATLFLIQINYKFGQGELWKYVRGKYFNPSEEERIFMFLDIASSTTIAEKIGHIRFFNFINDFYKDITDSILRRRGEIVDYVGDEIIVSWQLPDGLNSSNCIQCVIDIKEKIESLSEKYRKLYGFVPEFRAGLHYGLATVGEIGKIKKEITYFGDVMNTTSRIQGLCKESEFQLIISNDLLEQLPFNNYSIKSLGEVQLRGKSSPTKVFGVEIA